jgi:hypothetical protein
LHVTTRTGADTKIATGAFAGGYLLAPDGSALFYTALPASSVTGALYYLDLKTAGAQPKQLFARGYPAQGDPTQGQPVVVTPLLQDAFFSPSGNYLIVGIRAAGVLTSADVHVIDVHSGADVYSRPNGSFNYLQVLLPDDTMIFQDDALGTGRPATPVQTLYWISLPQAKTTQVATISTRTTDLQLTADGKFLVYGRTNGDVFAFDLTSKAAPGTKIASSVDTFVAATTKVAYIGMDHSVNVVGLDGSSALAIPAASGADPLSPLFLAPDEADLYFYQSVDTQDSYGTLLHAPVKAESSANVVAMKASIKDLAIADEGIVFLQNVRTALNPVPDGGMTPDGGQMGSYPSTTFGDAASARRDGSQVKSIGMGTPIGGLGALVLGSNWALLHLDGASVDGTLNMNALPTPIDSGSTIVGALNFAASDSGGTDGVLDSTVRLGGYEESDTGRDIAFIAGAKYDATVMNYVGTLDFAATRSPTTKIPSGLSGVSELAPIASRALFVNAPKATTPGVYYVTY